MSGDKNKGRALLNALSAWFEEKVNDNTLLSTGLDKGLFHAVGKYLPSLSEELLLSSNVSNELIKKQELLEQENRGLKRNKKIAESELARTKQELKTREVRAFLKKYDPNTGYQNFITEAVELGLMDSYEVINDRLQVRWITGGMCGGSCWDTGDEDHHYSRSSEEEPEFELLDKLVEHYYPNITMLKYKRMVQQCVGRTEEHENEYYGNHTDYGVKKLDPLKLYQFLQSEKVL